MPQPTQVGGWNATLPKRNVSDQAFLMNRDQGHDELLGRSERVNEPGFGRPAKGPLV